MRYTLLFLLTALISSCVKDDNSKKPTYFGGKIVNPKSKKVVLYDGLKQIDSAVLSAKNQFLFKFDSLKAGFYTMAHGPESQFVFLEPADSLLMRLNTWDFDESLVFSGVGANKNNLLINLFLQKENDRKNFRKLYTLNEAEFSKKLDSVLRLKRKFYQDYKQESNDNTSPLFDKIVNAIIEFPVYRIKEAYPYKHQKKLNLKEYPKLSDDFYAYRKNIDFNDADLVDVYVYRNYLRSHSYHIGHKKMVEDASNDPLILHYMKSVANDIEVQDIKNHLLDECVWKINLEHDELSSDKKREAHDLFLNNCTDATLKNSLELMLKDEKTLTKNGKLPDFKVQSINDEEILLNDVIKNKNAIIYFWPRKHRFTENTEKRVKYLQNKYPEFLFIGISGTNISKNSWKHHIKTCNLDSKNQFYVEDDKNDWLHLRFSKSILIDKNGKVTENFTHTNSKYFENKLKALQQN